MTKSGSGCDTFAGIGWIDAVAAGAYTLTVVHDGFASYQQTVRVPDKLLEISIALKIETVVVPARSPSNGISNRRHVYR